MAEESKLEAKLKKAVEKDGGLALKFVSPNKNGYPDRILLIAFGKIGFVEVKDKGKKPRKLQKIRHKELINLGFKVYVLDKEEQIPAIINQIKGGEE